MHIASHCWIANGIAGWARLPYYVIEQYLKWNQQFKDGTYRKTTGGPPKVDVPRELNDEVTTARVAETQEMDGPGLSEAEQRQMGSSRV